MTPPKSEGVFGRTVTLKQAKLKQQTACIENIDFKSSRGLDKLQILSLSACQWVREHHNILLVGATENLFSLRTGS